MKSLAEPAFPGDDGSVDPALAEVLSVYGEPRGVSEVLASVRIFVPIVPVSNVDGLGERETSGADKNADMATVFMTGADGRKALLAFSSVASLQAWNPLARPVPVWGRDAAEAASAEGATAVLLDLGSPHFTVIELLRS